MTSCNECGIVLADGMVACPLCGTLAVEGPPRAPEHPYVDVDGIKPVNLPMQPVVGRLLSLLAATAGVIVLLVDAVTGNGVGWSIIAVAAIGAGYVTLILPAVLRPRWLAMPAILLAMALLLLVIDFADGNGISWFGWVGLPILAGALLAIVAVAGALQLLGGFNLPAAVVAIGALLCLWIDLVLNFSFRGVVRLGWSYVVLLSAVPTILFLIALEHTVARYIDLRRRLHL